MLHPGISCGHREFCLRGGDVHCTSMQLLGEHRDGTSADFVSVLARTVFPMPAGFDLIEAAAVGVSYPTGRRMLFTKAKPRPCETARIFGIGGSVSPAALQLVKMIGARAIVTSCYPAKLVRATELGADATTESGREDIAARAFELTGGRGVDLVVENVGAAVWAQARKSLVRGGRIVTCGATTGDAPSADLRRLFIRRLQVLGPTHGILAEFQDLLAVCGRNRARPVIDSRFDLDHIRHALDRPAAGRQFGKIGVVPAVSSSS